MRYTKRHDWVRFEGDLAVIGLTNEAQKELGEIVYVELPRVGEKIEAEDEVCVVESTKAAIDLYCPLSGEVVEVNTALRENPEKINLSAEREGWLYKIKPFDRDEFDQLLTAEDYSEFH